MRGGSYNEVVFESYGLVTWWILALGLLTGVLPRARPSGAMLMLCGALLIYSAWTATSLLWTASAEQTTVEIARTLDYLGLVALIGAAVDRDTWRAAAAGVGVGAWLVCLLAIGSRLFPGAFPSGSLAAALGTDRLSYPFGYWNAVGAWGSMTATMSLAWGAHAQKWQIRALAAAIAPAALVMVYLSYSRAGAAGSGLGLLLVIALSRNRITATAHAAAAGLGAAVPILAIRSLPQIAKATGTHGAGTVAAALIFGTALTASLALVTMAVKLDKVTIPRKPARILIVAGALVLLIAAGAFGPHLVSRGWHSFTKKPAAVLSSDPTGRLANLSGSRYQVWKVALQAFDHQPATGTGAGTFGLYWNQHATSDEFLQDAHNIWLQNMAELGLPGLLAIILVMGSAIALGARVRARARRRGTAGPAVAFLAAFIVFLLQASVDWMWEETAITVLALAGLACVAARLSSKRPRLDWRLRAGLVVLALSASLVQVPGLLSTVEIDRSQAAERAGNAALAESWANDAVGAEPWSAAAFDQRGLVEESEGRYAAAASDLRRAIYHERTNYAHWLILARIETERDRLKPALADYRRAYDLRPRGALLKPGG
jgi:hypothetical protein